MKRVMGIDPGSHVTGWALVHEDGSRRACPCSGQLSLAAGDLAARLARLYTGLSLVLQEHSPECVAVESPFHAKSAKSALILGHPSAAEQL